MKMDAKMILVVLAGLALAGCDPERDAAGYQGPAGEPGEDGLDGAPGQDGSPGCGTADAQLSTSQGHVGADWDPGYYQASPGGPCVLAIGVLCPGDQVAVAGSCYAYSSETGFEQGLLRLTGNAFLLSDDPQLGNAPVGWWCEAMADPTEVDGGCPGDGDLAVTAICRPRCE